MAIKETARKIHFMPYIGGRGGSKAEDTASPTMSLSVKYSMLSFSKSLMLELGLEGKFIKLYFEPTRKIIGFQLKNALSEADLKSKAWKLVKPFKNQDTWKVSVGKMIAEFSGRLTKESYKNLPVKKYVERQGVMSSGDVFYYVQLIDNPGELGKGMGNDEMEDSEAE
jgi:hypothetical protein